MGNEWNRVPHDVGMTKREYFAVTILAGLVVDYDMGPEDYASVAVRHADSLIAELERSHDD